MVHSLGDVALREREGLVYGECSSECAKRILAVSKSRKEDSREVITVPDLKYRTRATWGTQLG